MQWIRNLGLESIEDILDLVLGPLVLSGLEILLGISSISVTHDPIANILFDVVSQLAPTISKRGSLLFLASRNFLMKRVFRSLHFL